MVSHKKWYTIRQGLFYIFAVSSGAKPAKEFENESGLPMMWLTCLFLRQFSRLLVQIQQKACILTIILIIAFHFPVQAQPQTKYEREFRVHSDKVPSNAKHFINSLSGVSRVRWYQEQGYMTLSFEAKFNLASKRYSIEFNKEGAIEDVEKETDIKALNDTTRQMLLRALGSLFSNFRIQKSQIQWVADVEAQRQLILEGRSNLPFTQNFELIVTASDRNQRANFEVLINSSGNILSSRKIVARLTDTLEY